MQPQIPQKQNLLQSRRFLTHHPTFSPTPTPAFAGIKFKQEEGKVNIVHPSLVGTFVMCTTHNIFQMPSQPMIPNNITNNSTPNPPGSISHFTASCLDWMVILLGYSSRQLLNIMFHLELSFWTYTKRSPTAVLGCLHLHDYCHCGDSLHAHPPHIHPALRVPVANPSIPISRIPFHHLSTGTMQG